MIDQLTDRLTITTDVSVNDVCYLLVHPQMDIFEAAQLYKNDNRPLVILAGKDYGSGSSRDWAAKGPWMLVSFTVVTVCSRHTDMHCLCCLLQS